MKQWCDLSRFVEAQAGTYDRALEEIRRGRKEEHWMWYIFPQMDGLGYSAKSHRYGIQSLEEAKAYLAHPLLGARLREITAALLVHRTNDAYAVMGSSVDCMKLRSSMTLFCEASGNDALFQAVLDKFFRGEKDSKTQTLIHRAAFEQEQERDYGQSGHSVRIPADVREIGFNVYGGADIRSVHIPGTVRSIGSFAFADSRVEKLTLEEGVEIIGHSAFDGCERLQTVVIPASVRRIEAYAFKDCKRLRSLTIRSSMTQIDSGAFLACGSLEEVRFPGGRPCIHRDAFVDCPRKILDQLKA